MLVAGMLISAAAMAMLWVSGASGFIPAMQVLVTLSQPHANPLSMVVQSIVPAAFEHPDTNVPIVMACAWLQIGLIAAAAIAAAYRFQA